MRSADADRELHVRRGRSRDCPAVFTVHRSAIEAACAPHYTRSEIRAWIAALRPERYAFYMASRDFFVAELDGEVIGFGQLCVERAAVEGLYVLPEHAGCGAGRALLRVLEATAAAECLGALVLDASLNAVSFYTRAGYKRERHSSHALGDGHHIACVRMRKGLAEVAASTDVGVLETDRLLLREFRRSDAPAVSELFADAEAMRFFPNMSDPGAATRWIARNQARYRRDGVGLWALAARADGEFLGDCGLIVQQLAAREHLEVGYHLVARARGHGYATEAARACMAYAFERLGADEVVSLVHVDNEPSHRVARRVHAGVRRGLTFKGLPHDVYYTEWADRGVAGLRADPT